MLLVFVVFFVVIHNQMMAKQEEHNKDILAAIRATIAEEISLAEQAVDGYSRTFFLPLTVHGNPYTLELSAGDIVVRYQGEETPLFPVATVTNHSISPGWNRISKFDGEITLTNASAVCGDAEIQSPNFDYVFEECDSAPHSTCPSCGVNCYCLN